MDAAPFLDDIAEAPAGARAFWLRAEDGVRIRAALWDEGAHGTVLLFPGRTEYIEKYGPAAGDLRQRGFATVVIDWRGQGLADRLLPDASVGHVTGFGDYQRDVTALAAAVRALGLPRPWFLLGHSMGGCIGLRSLHAGLDVRAAAFSAPMWGIRISPAVRPFAWALAALGRMSGYGHSYAPGTSPVTYVREAPFEDNTLTTDAAMFDFMKRQVTAHPELAIGGPSLHWLHEALVETRALRAMAPPPVPAYTALGRQERIVDTLPIHSLMQRWSGGRLEMYDGAEHELMMEGAATRARFFDAVAEWFRGQDGPARA